MDKPTRFPAVTIFQIDNSVMPKYRTLEMENAASVAFEVNVFDNTSGYKKQKAKDVMEDIDTIMARLGFLRIMCSPTPNLVDATIYRLTARYTAAVDQELWIYSNS